MITSNWICVSLTLSLPLSVLIVGVCTYVYMLKLDCVEVPCMPVPVWQSASNMSACIVAGCSVPYTTGVSMVVVNKNDPCDYGCDARKSYARSGSISLICVGSAILLASLVILPAITWYYASPAAVAPASTTHHQASISHASTTHQASQIPVAVKTVEDVEMANRGCEECTICLEAVGEGGCQTRCKHWFHKHCLGKWLHVKRTCPVCCHDL